MKILKLILAFLLLFPVLLSAQQLSGVWIGKLSNDSATGRKDQSYELALTEYKSKVMGYSHATFIVNDTLYYIVKRVKGVIKDGICEVEDDDIIAHNFGKKLEKGVKMTHILRLGEADSAWHLDGNWNTNATKKFHALSGNIALKEEKDFDKSKLLQHLGDLNLDNTLSFYKPEKKVYLPRPVKTEVKKQETDIAKSEPKINDQAKTKSSLSNIELTTPAIAKNDAPEKEEPVIKAPDVNSIATEQNNVQKIALHDQVKQNTGTPVVKTDNKTIPEVIKQTSEPEIKKPDASVVATSQANNTVKKNPESEIQSNNSLPVVKTGTKTTPEVQKQTNAPEIKKPEASVVTTSQTNAVKKEPVTDIKSNNSLPVVKADSKPIPGPQNHPDTILIKNPEPALVKTADQVTTSSKTDTGNAVDIAEQRNKRIIQTVNYKSDSLVLSLYDNGEIDGDTVSVFLNGEVLLDKQGLKAVAIKKTIYLEPGKDEEVEILLYAENLGKYPPNTGLLIIRDGDDRYEIRFSADYDLSPAIILRRKKL